MIKINIQGSKGRTVDVSSNQELLVVKRFSSAQNITLVSDNVAVNLIAPRSGEKVIITGLIVNTNRDIGVNGAKIEIYEATGPTETTVETAIMTFDLPKNETVPLNGLLIETNEGKYINAKADDSEVNITLLCYFAPV